MAGEPHPLDGLAATVLNLALDAVAAEVVTAAREGGIEPILLKGPSFAGWLDDRDRARRYRDIDLLVNPRELLSVEHLLAELGFEPQPILGEPQRHQVHARAWHRPGDGATIDLHRTLAGVHGVAPEEVWAILQSHRAPLVLGGTTVTMLDEPARTFLVALHVFHHRLQEPVVQAKPLRDLTAAVQRIPDGTWAAALELADRLHARAAIGTALEVVDGGPELATRLGIPLGIEPDAASGAVLGPGFERFAAAEGWRARARLLLSELFPSPEYLRWSSPLARRGRRGLAAAYVERPLWLLRHMLPSIIAWRRARSRTRRAG